jgi:hypothetical protein
LTDPIIVTGRSVPLRIDVNAGQVELSFTRHSGLYSLETQNMKVKRPIFTKRKPPTRRVEKLNMLPSE